MCTIWQCFLLDYFFLLLLTCRHACACNFYFKAECKLFNNSISFSTHVAKNKALRGSVKLHRKREKFEVSTCFGGSGYHQPSHPESYTDSFEGLPLHMFVACPGPQAVKCPPFPSESPLQFVDS